MVILSILDTLLPNDNRRSEQYWHNFESNGFDDCINKYALVAPFTNMVQLESQQGRVITSLSVR